MIEMLEIIIKQPTTDKIQKRIKQILDSAITVLYIIYEKPPKEWVMDVDSMDD